MRVFFETPDGIQLYVSEVNQEIVKFHSTEPHTVIAALKEEANGEDPIAKILAKGTLAAIEAVGIEVIEG